MHRMLEPEHGCSRDSSAKLLHFGTARLPLSQKTGCAGVCTTAVLYFPSSCHMVIPGPQLITSVSIPEQEYLHNHSIGFNSQRGNAQVLLAAVLIPAAWPASAGRCKPAPRTLPQPPRSQAGRTGRRKKARTCAKVNSLSFEQQRGQGCGCIAWAGLSRLLREVAGVLWDSMGAEGSSSSFSARVSQALVAVTVVYSLCLHRATPRLPSLVQRQNLLS